MADGPDALRIEKAMAYTGIADTGRALEEAIKQGIVGPDRWVSPFQDAKGKSTIGMYKDQPGTSPAPAAQSNGGGGTGGAKPKPKPPKSPIEEAAEKNIYFPMLVPEYSAPQALDYSAYTYMSPFGGDGGLLYQPGTQQYREAYPIADNILSYQPPQLGFPQVTYSNPIALNFVPFESSGGGGGFSETTPTNTGTPFEERGGKGPGDVGYNASLPAYGYPTFGDFIADMTDRLQGGQGITAGDMAGWGGSSAGVGVGVSGGSSGVGPGGVGGGVGKGY